jgi:citrate lyase gamma subunit
MSVRSIAQFFPQKRIWLILDEWSSIPMELQPFLADMLKRACFNIQNITVKIGAVEHRTRLFLEQGEHGRLGLEPTADIRTDIRLDDYLLFDNDKASSVAFFKDFLFKHVRSICKEKGFPEPDTSDQLIRVGFSQKNAFEEFVKSVEGVPRDAIHIASNCAQKAFGKNIDIPTVRQAAHRYYTEDKSSQVEDNPALRELLRFIVDNAIRRKKTNSFLLEFGIRDRNIDLLFDRRLVHIRRRNVSSRDNPGARYYHYKIDYGCYVDLAATQQMPQEHDFSQDMEFEDIAARISVPTEDDARSYRRSILDLEDFYKEFPQFRPDS